MLTFASDSDYAWLVMRYVRIRLMDTGGSTWVLSIDDDLCRKKMLLYTGRITY